MLGEPVNAFLPSVGNPMVQADSRRMIRDLWASWEGDNWVQSEIMIVKLTELGGWVLNLFPIMKFKDAIERYQMRVVGDEVEFSSWEFNTHVLGEKGLQEFGKILNHF